MSISHPTLRERATYGWRVMRRAAGVMMARLGGAPPLNGMRPAVPFNAMFDIRTVSHSSRTDGA